MTFTLNNNSNSPWGNNSKGSRPGDNGDSYSDDYLNNLQRKFKDVAPL